MATENFTLNQFYSESKRLIEKHDCTDSEFILRVQFEIIEDCNKDSSPRLDCIISYERNHECEFFAVGRSPKTALYKFEEKLIESKGQWPTPQIVSVDLTSELIQPEFLED
jgi:hypothetical protein